VFCTCDYERRLQYHIQSLCCLLWAVHKQVVFLALFPGLSTSTLRLLVAQAVLQNLANCNHSLSADLTNQTVPMGYSIVYKTTPPIEKQLISIVKSCDSTIAISSYYISAIILPILTLRLFSSDAPI